jgi:hypothetical protein
MARPSSHPVWFTGAAMVAASALLGGCGGGKQEGPGADTAGPAVRYDYALSPFAFGDRCGFVDAKGKLAIQPQFEAARNFVKQAGLAPVKVGGKWGLVDRDGRLVVAPQFQAIDPSGDGKSFWVQLANRWGLIDARGQFLINPRFQAVRSDFDAKGRAVVQVGGKEGVIDRHGTLVIPASFSRIVVGRLIADGRAVVFTDGLAAASQDGRRGGYIDEKGAWKINPQFTTMGWFGDGGLAAASVGVGPQERYGFIDHKGAWVIQPQFEQVFWFGPGGLAPVKVGNAWGFIDRKGAYRVNPQFSAVMPFHKGAHGLVAPVAVKGADGVDRWGVIDARGEYRVQPQFDGLGAFDRNDRAVARMGDQLGLIDGNGRFLVNPMFAAITLIPGTSDYRVTRAVGAPGARANTVEISRMNRDGKLSGTVTGVACPAG